jgi:signal peptidase I
MKEKNKEIKTEKKPELKRVIKEWIQSLLIAFIVAMFIRTFFIQPYRIPSGSMLPTLKIGDHPLVNKLIYKMREPERGDVVVFLYPVIQYGCTACSYRYKFLKLFPRSEYAHVYEYPEGSTHAIGKNIPFEKLPDDWVCPLCGAGKEHFERLPRKPFIKRLVGLPGESIEIKGGEIYINGRPLDGPLSITDRHYIMDGEYGRKEVKIPLGSYYVLGDNFNNSKDSRFWGFVPKKNLIGKATFIYWPVWKMRIIR